MGFEGTVRHPASLNFRLFFSLFARRATALGSSGGRPGWLRPGRALAALVLAAGLWLRGPGKSSSWVSKAPSKPQFSALFRSLFARRATARGSSGGRPCFGCEALASLLSGFRRYR